MNKRNKISEKQIMMQTSSQLTEIVLISIPTTCCRNSHMFNIILNIGNNVSATIMPELRRPVSVTTSSTFYSDLKMLALGFIILATVVAVIAVYLYLRKRGEY